MLAEWLTPPDELSDVERSSMAMDPPFQPSDITKRLTITIGTDGALTIAAAGTALRAGVAGRHELRSLPEALQDPLERRQ
jgi:hypothetical protein